VKKEKPNETKDYNFSTLESIEREEQGKWNDTYSFDHLLLNASKAIPSIYVESSHNSQN
jgi:hypothetical protein